MVTAMLGAMDGRNLSGIGGAGDPTPTERAATPGAAGAASGVRASGPGSAEHTPTERAAGRRSIA